MDVYELKYTQSVTEQGSSPVSPVYTIPTEDNEFKLSPLNSPWATAGVYAGALGENGSLINVQTVLTFPGWNAVEQFSDMRDCTASRTAVPGTINLRFMAVFGTGVVELQKGSFKWTGMADDRKSAIDAALSDNLNPGQVQNVFNPYSRTTNKISMTGTANSPLNIAPLNSLKINNLIWLPFFVIREVEYYNYDAASNSYGNVTITDSVSKTWAEIKPEDKSPAGADYDADLFEKGWKEITATQEDGRRFRYVAAVELVPYYGKCSNTYNSAADTYTAGVNPDDGKTYGDRQILGTMVSDAYPTIGTTKCKRPALCVYSEYYDPTTGSVIYTIPAGLHFLNTPGGGTSYNQYIQPAMTLTSTYNKATNTSAATTWTDFWFNNNDNYTNMFRSIMDPATDPGDPTTVCPGIAVDFSTSISLVDSSYPTGQRYYLDTTGPVAYSYNRSTRTNFFNRLTFYSISELWATIASLGCYVADSRDAAIKAPIGDYVGQNNHIYLGEMTASGTTTGRMIQGSDIQDQPQAKIDDIIQNTPYTPVIPGPAPEPGGDIDDDYPEGDGFGGNFQIGYGDLALAGSFVQYVTTGLSGLIAIKSQISAATDDTFWDYLGQTSRQGTGADLVETITSGEPAFLGDYILSVRQYPFSISGTMLGSGATNTKLAFGFKGAKIENVTHTTVPVPVCRLSFGSVAIPYMQTAKTFADFEPYTRASVFLPGIGEFPLSATMVVGRTMSVDYIVDLTTGTATAIVTAADSDGNTVEVLCESGQIGTDIGITGNDIYAQAAAMVSAYNKTFSNVASAATGVVGSAATAVATGDPAKLADYASGLHNVKTAVIEGTINDALASRDVPRVITSASGIGSHVGVNIPYFKIERPLISIPENYGHSVGYLWNKSARIGDLSGYTVCENVDVSGIPGTDAERSMIKSMLEGGFYA